MKRGRWFLPEEPDVVRLIRAQLAVTLTTLDDFGAWAGGEAAAGGRVRDSAERGDAAKRALTGALRSAFVLPIEPEDVFTISRGIDWIRRDAADVVAEAGVLACEPDAGLAEVAAVIRQAAGLLDGAIAKLVEDGDAATAAPRRRSRPSQTSPTPTSEAWPPCSTSKTAAPGSAGASSIAAAPGSATSSSRSPSASCTRWSSRAEAQTAPRPPCLPWPRTTILTRVFSPPALSVACRSSCRRNSVR